MTCNKKGPCKEEKEKNVEKLTDEKLDGVAGGIVCRPLLCMPRRGPVPGEAENKRCNPGLCNPLCAPNT